MMNNSDENQNKFGKNESFLYRFMDIILSMEASKNTHFR